MNNLTSIFIGVVIGLVIGYFLWGSKREILKQVQNDYIDIIREKEVEKAANLEKMRDLISTQEKITNDDVQELLKVSAVTAERYLDELESQGIIEQKGVTGQSVYYTKI